MSTISAPVRDRADERFRANADAMAALVADLRERLQRVRQGGGEASVERHRSRGKLTARERIDLVIDPDTALLELSALAADGVYEEQPASAGIVCAIGEVSGQRCMIIANDATVKGGSYFPLTVKKHLRAQEIAEQ